MDSTELQHLAEVRLGDAGVLIAAGRWDAAYYLLGYCVECALKACVAKQFHEYEVPDKRLVERFYTHSLDELLKLSGIKPEMEKRLGDDSGFNINWSAVRDWNEAARYEVGKTEAVARSMYDAVTNGASGILPWLKTQW